MTVDLDYFKAHETRNDRLLSHVGVAECIMFVDLTCVVNLSIYYGMVPWWYHTMVPAALDVQS